MPQVFYLLEIRRCVCVIDVYTHTYMCMCVYTYIYYTSGIKEKTEKTGIRHKQTKLQI